MEKIEKKKSLFLFNLLILLSFDFNQNSDNVSWPK